MIYKSIVTTLVLTLFFIVGCPGEKKVSSEEVIEAIVGAMCKKMATCQPNAMPGAEFCEKTMKAALAGHKDKPNLNTTKKQLDACVKSIETTECEGLLGDKPPKDCDFLK